MAYTPQEIQHLQQLATSKDTSNLLLTVALCQPRGIVPALATTIYWLQHRLYWIDQTEAAQVCQSMLQQVTTTPTLLASCLSKSDWLSIAHLNQCAQQSLLELPWLCDTTIDYFFGVEQLDYFTLKFLLQYCHTSNKERLILSLKKTDHLGRKLLDLGNLGLGQMPEVLQQPNDISILSLWGNQLQSLPDIWHYYDQLEELSLTHNQLQTLPPSFGYMSNLQRLYLHNNPLEPVALEAILLQLPQLHYLSLSSGAEARYQMAYLELETLVNEGLLQASTNEKKQYLRLLLPQTNDSDWLSKEVLLEALSYPQSAINKAAKEQLLERFAVTTIPPDAHIAILGLVTFALRKHIQHLQQHSPLTLTDRVTPQTTHVVLGQQLDMTIDISPTHRLLTEQTLLRY